MPISDYVRELRAVVGHRQLLLPSVTVLVWEDTGRLLMVQNAEERVWQTVGGSVEPGEHPRDAARREALEETGLVVELQAIRGVVGGPMFEHTYPNGDQVAFVSTVFDATPVGGRLLSDGDGDEVSAARWFAPAALATTTMHAFTYELLRQMDVLGAG